MEDFIRTCFKDCITPEVIDILTTEKAIDIYTCAFTTKEMNRENNYEMYELFGDSIWNRCVIEYMGYAFPDAVQKNSVDVLTQLKLKHISKDFLSKTAADLGMKELIRATPEEWQKHEIDILEDVLEAFIGATNRIVVSHYSNKYKRSQWQFHGVGDNVAYTFIKKILDKANPKIDYFELRDAFTRVLGVIDKHQELNITHTERESDDGQQIVTFLDSNKGRFVIATSTKKKKKDAKIAAAQETLHYIKTQYGIGETIPAQYKGM